MQKAHIWMEYQLCYQVFNRQYVFFPLFSNNWAAKLICCATKQEHATPYLRELHWLPVRERIMFKIMLYMYKSQHGLAPVYLQSLLQPYIPGRSNLRSATDVTRLQEQNTINWLQTASNRTFSITAPHIWNSLAISIRNSPSLSIFRKSLKHNLFPV